MYGNDFNWEGAAPGIFWGVQLIRLYVELSRFEFPENLWDSFDW
ncbi:hypothetical protein CG017_01695 [Burkholderia glumae]|nr:hypothetical protein KS03_1709 [Burkholderia glumae LMG 2196 = ATCC 33617]QKM53679.1 hypothetical protein CG017_01695 [Burkholderia glumae]